MKKVFFLLLLTLLSITKAIAQNNLPPVYEITTDTVLNNTLPDPYWQILEDNGDKLSFEEVSKSPLAEKFHYNTGKKLLSDRSNRGYWFRYVLKNQMAYVTKICFNNGLNDFNEQSEFYYINSHGEVNRQVNGFITPWSKLNGLKEYRIIPIELRPGEQLVVYRRVFNSFRYFFLFGYYLGRI